MRPLRLRLAVAAVLLAAPACFPPERPVARPVPYEGYAATYPTGLRLVTYERPSIDRVLVGVSIGGGVSDEPAGKAGIAHLAEHVAYRARSGPDRIWDRLQSAGVTFNGMTGHDTTEFWEIGQPDQLPLMLAVESDRLRDPLAGVTQADLDAERDIVLNEARERDQFQPERLGIEALLRRAFGDAHPYGRPFRGDEASLRSVTLDDLRAWFRERYRPDRVVVVVVGPAPAKETGRLAFDALRELATGTAIPVGPTSRDPAPSPPDPPAALETVRAPVLHPTLLLGFAVPAADPRDAARAFAGAELLGATLGARFSREDFSDAVGGVGSDVLQLERAALVVVAIELARERDAPRVLATARDTLVRAVDERVAFIVGRAVRERLLTESLLALEELDAPSITGFVRRSGKPDYLGGWQQAIALGYLKDDIHTYCWRNLTRARSAAVLVAPGADPAAPDLLTAPASLRPGTEEHGDRDDPVAPRTPVAELARPPGLDRAVREVLPNGLAVVVARRGALPIAEARLVFRTDPAGADGVPALAAGAALASIGRASDMRWDHARRIGAIRGTRLSHDTLSVRERGASGNVDQILDDLAAWHDRFDVTERGVSSLRAWASVELAALERDPSDLARRALLDRLFPASPYGRAATPADVAALTRGAVQRWASDEVRPDRATLLVVGDVDPAAVLAKVRAAFGGWRRGDAPVRAVAPPALPGERRLVLVDRPGARQTLVLAGMRLPPLAERDAPATEALAWRLRHALERMLRVDAGVSYGVAVQTIDHPAAAALVVATSVDARATAATLERTLATIDALSQHPLAKADVDRVRWQLARELALGFDTVGRAAAALETSAVNGLPPDAWEREAASTATVSAERILAVARAAVGHEVVVIVGDAAALAPQLRAAAFEPDETIRAPEPSPRR